jgi:hypothetical protein
LYCVVVEQQLQAGLRAEFGERLGGFLLDYFELRGRTMIPGLCVRNTDQHAAECHGEPSHPWRC